jgi:hypothetical protein
MSALKRNILEIVGENPEYFWCSHEVRANELLSH